MVSSMNPFHEWLAELAGDSLVRDETAEGLEREARNNCWSFSISPEQARSLTKADVMGFVDSVIGLRRQQILNTSAGRQPMTFYCWYDEQAGQLRFSLASASHGRLPFGARFEECQDLDSIVRRFLDSSYRTGIPLSEFEPERQETAQGAFAVAPDVLRVWTKRLP